MLSRFFPVVLEPLWMIGSLVGATVGWVATLLQLAIVNRWYLKQGRLDATQNPRRSR